MSARSHSKHTTVEDTHNVTANERTYDHAKSYAHYMTRDVLPTDTHYRNIESIADGKSRPTLEELRQDEYAKPVLYNDEISQGNCNKYQTVLKFGWIQGVYMRCLLNIWGVMLFLRLTWVVGQSGLFESLLIITLANVVTVVTALSMSAVATNGHIKAGGIYYMISRSLGPEFGASIGLLFTLSNAVACAMYVVGFCSSVSDMFKEYFDIHTIIAGGVNDTRILGVITMFVILVIAIIGMEWVTKVQLLLLFLLIAAQFDFVIGVLMGPQTTLEFSRGFSGLSWETLKNNMWSDYQKFEGRQFDFFGVFSVFFPAVTGIVAGANLSGDLKSPGEAIPKGTLLAILTTFISYLLYAAMIAAAAIRYASGIPDELTVMHVQYSAVNTSTSAVPLYPYNVCSAAVRNLSNPCMYGLQNNMQMMGVMSAWSPLIYIGTFAATLSSALASLVGAPRVLQALANDRLYPYLHVFGKGFGSNNDPLRGYIAVFIIATVCVLIGELNSIANLSSEVFLAAYALINLSCFHASFVRSPGWRPDFKFYNAWISLFGFFSCIGVMFLCDSIVGSVVVLASFSLYLFVSYQNLDVNWGSTTQAQAYVSALSFMHRLGLVKEHVKNYRPQVIVFSGQPNSRPALIDFANCITKNISLLVVANCLPKSMCVGVRHSMYQQGVRWLNHFNVKAFYSILCLDCPSSSTCSPADSKEGDVGDGLAQHPPRTSMCEGFARGSVSLMQLTGLGNMRPNVVLFGYKNNWNTCPPEELAQYFQCIHGGFDCYMAMALLRVRGGLDYSTYTSLSELSTNSDKLSRKENSTDFVSFKAISGSADLTPSFNDLNNPDRMVRFAQTSSSTSKLDNGGPPTTDSSTANISLLRPDINVLGKVKYTQIKCTQNTPAEESACEEVCSHMNMFRRLQPAGYIDVWWIYDDGGLTLLLPYILSTRSQWAKCKLRVFTIASKHNELDMEKRSMASLLSKFRIDYSDVIVIDSLHRKPLPATVDMFDKLVQPFNEDSCQYDEMRLCPDDLEHFADKTRRHLRLSELVREHSASSSLVVLTLPMPRKGATRPPIYMAWMEMLSRDMPPFLLVRGNQTSVLTYYS